MTFQIVKDPSATATVETILKQLEYDTKRHIATQTILFKFKTALFLVPFSSLILLLFFKQHYSSNNPKPFIYSPSQLFF